MGSDAANLAADRLDGALTVAEEYVDRYLPPDPSDKTSDGNETSDDRGQSNTRSPRRHTVKNYPNFYSSPVNSDSKTTEGVSKTARTIHHGARFSRKLQRRLTRRTVAEARALKEQGTECIHVLLYVAELVSDIGE